MTKIRVRFQLPLITTTLMLGASAFAQTPPATTPSDAPPAKEDTQSDKKGGLETTTGTPQTPTPPADTKESEKKDSDKKADAQPQMKPPQVPATPPPVDRALLQGGWTSLRLMHEKGVLTDAEYDAALKDIGTKAADSNTFVMANLAMTIYGFAQGDYRFDTTQSCTEFCANSQIARQGTLQGDHGRTQFSVRDSRIGFRVAGTPIGTLKTSGVLEADFLGAQAGTTEQAIFVNPVLRVRHAFVKFETSFADFLIGQTWSPFGWQATYLAPSVQWPGLPGQMFERTEQLRISKTFKSDDFTFEMLIAALRPPQRDSAVPEGVAGLRFALNKWTAMSSNYLTLTSIQPASIAITGDLRHYELASFANPQKSTNGVMGGGVAIDAFIPIIPATKDNKDNSFAIYGEFAYGEGTADAYTGLGAAGVVNAAIPSAMMGGAATPYVANFDPGLAAYDAGGNFETIHWQSYLVGAQYYFPGVEGRAAIFGNYGHMKSPNAHRFNPAKGRVRDSESYFELGMLFDPTKSTRLAAGWALYDDVYADPDPMTGDKTHAQNHSIHMTGFIFF